MVKTAVDIVIFDHKGRVLLGKRLVEAGFGCWGFPGGHLKTNEKINECARREIKEELGDKIEIALTNEILAVRENSIAPHFSHHLTVTIKGNYEKGKIANNEPNKCKGWEWFSLDKLPSQTFSGMREILINYKKGKVLVVSDWE